MATTEIAEWEILAAAAEVTTTTVTIIDASSPTPSSTLRTLTHPDSTNFPVVTYNRNPDRTLNFDTAPLFPPASETLRTLGTTQAFITQNALDDVIITERWEAGGTTASMIAAQFRRFYELVLNQPVPADPEVFIQWAPADRTTSIFNVVLLSLKLGGGDKLDFKEWGSFSAGDLDALQTGIIDRVVDLEFKIVSEV